MNKRRMLLQTACIGTMNLLTTIGVGLMFDEKGNILIYILSAVLVYLFTGLILSLTNRNTNKVLKEINYVIHRYNDGDFTVRIKKNGVNKRHKELLEQFDLLRNMLNTWIYELLHSAVAIKNAAEKIHQDSERTTQGMEELNTSLNEISIFFNDTSSMLSDVSSAADQLAVSGSSIAQYSTEAVDNVRVANEAAQSGGSALAQVSSSMEIMQSHISSVYERMVQLEQVSNQISTITDTITAISRQTTLLALNASIEAARAGEHGKGFAIVANEVRALSEETKEASSKINNLILAVQTEIQATVSSMKAVHTEVEEGVTVTAHATINLNHVISMTKDVMAFINKISRDVNEQSLETDLISSNTRNVSGKSQSGSSSVQEISCVMENQAEDIRNTNNTTYELLNVSRNLETVMERFDLTLGEQMIKVCSQINDLLQKKELTNEELVELTKDYGVSEIHVVSKSGLIMTSSNPVCLNYQFSDCEGTQTYEFTQILKDPTIMVNQKAAFRDVDGKLFKYAGISRSGRSGIVQVGLDASKLTEFTGINEYRVHKRKKAV